MNCNEMLLELPLDDFIREVKQCFQDYKSWQRNKSQRARLTGSNLAQSSLLIDCLLSGENKLLTPEKRLVGIEALLYWGVAPLKPAQPSNNNNYGQWQRYHSLQSLYLEQKTGQEVLWLADISTEAELYRIRDLTIKEVAQAFRQELLMPTDINGRQRFLIERRLQSCSTNIQTFIQFLAIIQENVNFIDVKSAIQNPTTEWELKNEHIPDILQCGLVGSKQAQMRTIIWILPEAQEYIYTRLDQKQKQTLHILAAAYHKQIGNLVQALIHYVEAGKFETAAHLLITNESQLLSQGKSKLLYDLIQQVPFGKIEDRSWVRLQVIAGKAALQTKNIKVATTAFTKALSNSMKYPYEHALAAYQLARTNEYNNIDESIAFYDLAIQKLLHLKHHHKLLVDIHIDKAWIFIQERTDLEQAQKCLDDAQKLLTAEDYRRQARLYNARAKISRLQDDFEQELSCRLQARVSARLTHESKIMFNMAYNLGQAYIWPPQLQVDLGLNYIEEAMTLAQTMADQQCQAKCHYMRGVGAFFGGHKQELQGQKFEAEEEWQQAQEMYRQAKAAYKQAITHYLTAYRIFKKTKNLNWLATVCGALAEAYAKVGDRQRMQMYLDLAIQAATDSGAKQVMADIERLTVEVVGMRPPNIKLDERQWLAYEYVQENDRITKEEYHTLIRDSSLKTIARETASRHLRQMVKKGVFAPHKKGRSTYYVLKE